MYRKYFLVQDCFLPLLHTQAVDTLAVKIICLFLLFQATHFEIKKDADGISRSKGEGGGWGRGGRTVG